MERLLFLIAERLTEWHDGSMVRDAWLELRQKISAALGGSRLRGPVDESGLDAFKAITGYDIHPDLLELYRVNDGEGSNFRFVFGGYFLSMQDAAETQRELREVYEEEPMDSKDDLISLGYPYPQITPFLTDECGNYIGIDNAPSPAGRYGQICTYGADLDSVSVIFGSLEELFQFLIAQVDSGNYEADISSEGSRFLWLYRDEYTRRLTTVIGGVPETVVY